MSTLNRWTGATWEEVMAAPVTHAHDAADVPFTPPATMTATDVQAALVELAAVFAIDGGDAGSTYASTIDGGTA